ncbi:MULTISPECIES: FG-GAP-like repeat-containing protein [unclassified Streptomyces]|uniref:FG-GAP-like repeat-containing protein n=1 Tax=unclassified Streptomyces TaxID=2593676 RepID=UPI001164AE25|nr:MULTISPECIES: FG-GAP-like repeat-containing protein [unclassified Streptomyces]NMI59764.1 VCBS repeat-containing protein [Streptomyces sp. RLA2-12]QDN59006.1 VCBS repeat-containing protein [Streptomyces sp. S1D4-20]QDN69071.1 VCBS repeat-containing protein [Streptomyces sp. S1D4-14]QDO51489.1 VCBS repeat-containing protein [Streptomyces sp. RLB3-5]QDO61727.1 VCBS repeat-containing protein [Streptomyces sp. RLB1-8]
MGRRALVRGATAATVSFTLALGLGSLTVGSAHGGTVTGEVLVPAATAMVPRTGLLSAGPSGFLRYEEGLGQLWTTYDGVDTVVDASGTDVYGVTSAGAGSDVVARYDTSARTVTLRNMTSGQISTVALPDGHFYFSTLGSTVVTTAGTPGADSTWHLLDARADGSVSDRTVQGVPSGVHLQSAAGLGDAHGQVVQYRKGDDMVTGWLDVEQGRFTALPYTVQSWNYLVALSPTHLVWYYDGTLHVASRQDPAAAVRTVRVGEISQVLGLVGDNVIVSRYDSSLGQNDTYRAVSRVEAVPLDGSAPRTLLARTSRQAVPTPDGGLLVAGGADTDHWGVSLIEAAEGGGVTVRRIADAHPRQAAHTVSQLTLAQGRLTTVETDPVGDWSYLHTRETGVADSPTAGARTTRGRIVLENYSGSRPRLLDTGDGRTVVSGYGTSAAQQPQLLGADRSLPGTRIDSSRSYQTATAAGGRFAALTRPYDSKGVAETRVVDLDSGRTVFTTTDSVRAIWGTTVWVMSGNDTVVPYDLLTGKQGEPVWFGRGCLLNDFQAVGRWLLWNCVLNSEGQGVYDTVTKRNLTLVSGSGWEQAQLGDGFVATVEAGQLKVIDVRGGTPVSHTAGGFEGNAWDVDPYTGVIAQLRSDNAIRLTSSDVPVSALVQRDATVAASVDVKGGAAPWSPKWWLNKPAASWKLVIGNKATGAAVRTLSGGLSRGVVSPAWNGKDGSGRLVPNGAYTWTLTVTPADGQGAALTRTGTVKVTGAAAVRRDFVGSDGFGELVTLNGSGGLTYQYGTGKGTFTGKLTGSGWATSIKAVPFGDLSGDRCNDVLVRFSSGALRAYRPACGAAVTPSTAYTSLGSGGWQQYDVLTAPGDVSGDGRPDLIARNPSTGTVYLYKGTSAGNLSARVKLYDNWKTYKKIVGAGDLNGDGIGDLLAQDKANNLYRYDGTGKGTFKARVKLFGNWGGSYDAIVGVGDITGDGKADIVSRDTSGAVWRNNGNGKGSFGGRTKIATGWQGYKGLF